MFPVSVINAASLQVAINPVSVLRMRGNFRGTTADRWLMVFNSDSTPADGIEPMIPAIPLYQSAPFFVEEEIGALEFTLGCYVCVSTTQDTKTLSTDTMDFSAELSDPEYPSTGTTEFVSSTTWDGGGFSVWTEAQGASGTFKLKKLEVDGTNLEASQAFIQLFATDTVNDGDIPIISFPISRLQKLTGENALTFGSEGRDIFSIDSFSPFTNRTGCSVALSTNGLSHEGVTYLAPGLTIIAKYRVT